MLPAARAARPPAAAALLDSDRGGGDPAGLLEERAEIEALCQALAELPRAQREAIVLREFYGLSYREVAAALGLSGPAVESLLFKSRRRLQERLRPIRAASSVLLLPPGARDALAAAIPGFPGAAASGAGAVASAGALAKLGAAPLAAKLAAGLLVLGAGTAIGLEEAHHPGATRRRPPARVDEAPPAPAHASGLLSYPTPPPGLSWHSGGSTADTGARDEMVAAERERDDREGAERPEARERERGETPERPEARERERVERPGTEAGQRERDDLKVGREEARERREATDNTEALEIGIRSEGDNEQRAEQPEVENEPDVEEHESREADG